MSKHRSITQQAMDELRGQLRIGKSKHQAKIDEGTHSPEGIFSWSTYHSYQKHAAGFCSWCKAQHPECRKLEDARRYVRDYLKMRIDSGLSAWTVHLDASALAKVFHCHTGNFGVKLPSRMRENIVRSRAARAHDKEVSEPRNRAVADFCRGTGLRRKELGMLEVDDVEPDGSRVHVRNGKGGKERWVNVLPRYQAHVAACAANAKGRLVFQKTDLKHRLDIHGFRREYAQAVYAQHARDLKTLPKEELYFCRKDKAGTVYDRQAMLIVSRNLGHNRISVVAGNYL